MCTSTVTAIGGRRSQSQQRALPEMRGGSRNAAASSSYAAAAGSAYGGGVTAGDAAYGGYGGYGVYGGYGGGAELGSYETQAGRPTEVRPFMKAGGVRE